MDFTGVVRVAKEKSLGYSISFEKSVSFSEEISHKYKADSMYLESYF